MTPAEPITGSADPDEPVDGPQTSSDGIGTHARSLRSLLRGLPVLRGHAPSVDFRQAPDEPQSLFYEWLQRAIADDVPEPHAMTLSTADADGAPDARVLICKDVDELGWHFAISAASPKGRQLAARPQAALTFYWPAHCRQVRIRGTARSDGAQAAGADFRARSLGSRAIALTLRQSEPFDGASELAAALDAARSRLSADDTLVPDQWISYALRADTVEFWQGDEQRLHRRLSYRYEPQADVWTRQVLWP